MINSSTPEFSFSKPGDPWVPVARITWPKIQSQVWEVLLSEWGRDPESLEAWVCKILLERSGLEIK